MTMGYTMSQDRNPYYDSVRDKPDRSEFASLSMDLQNKRQPASSGGGGAVLKIVVCVVVLVIIGAVAKRFLLA